MTTPKRKELTHAHIPIGSVVELDNYTLNNGHLQYRYKHDVDHKKAVVTVRDVHISVSMTGTATLLTVDVPRDVNLFEPEGVAEYHVLNITHVSRVLKMGTVYPNIGARFLASLPKMKFPSGPLDEYFIRGVVYEALLKVNPLNDYTLEDAVDHAFKHHVFKRKLSDIEAEKAEEECFRRRFYHVSRKKLKRWAKQNANRFIMTQKGVRLRQEALDKEMWDDYVDQELD